MPARIRDKNTNQILFDTSSRLGRFIGKIEVNGAAGNGEYSDPRLANGKPFALFFSDGSGSSTVVCLASVSGQIIKWEFGGYGANNGENPSGYILYGVF
ncbi:hypothetical protein [Undibacterium curvum]|uniref:hypothetical protein n=1 Tax=Undibacterium curvum TaxID=2762294 RepID=UPI003D1169AF